MTIFEARVQSMEKYERNTTTLKIPNATQASFRRGEMLICQNCGKNWNEHAGYFVGGLVPGACLTKENLRETNTELL